MFWQPKTCSTNITIITTWHALLRTRLRCVKSRYESRMKKNLISYYETYMNHIWNLWNFASFHIWFIHEFSYYFIISTKKHEPYMNHIRFIYENDLFFHTGILRMFHEWREIRFLIKIVCFFWYFKFYKYRYRYISQNGPISRVVRSMGCPIYRLRLYVINMANVAIQSSRLRRCRTESALLMIVQMTTSSLPIPWK